MPLFDFGERYVMFDATPVENLFIQEYMLRAEGEFVKVYLYGLMQCYHPVPGATLQTLARDLGMDEERVRNAFAYWERMGLVRRVSDNPPSYVYVNLKQSLLMKAQDDDGLYRYAEFNQSLQAQFGPDRLLAPQDYERVYDWIEGLGLPETVVQLLVAHCIRTRGLKFRFSAADKVAHEWAQAGVRTVADAEDMMRRSGLSQESLKKVLRRLGKRHAPSMDDEALFAKWTQEWGFSTEAILAACAETTKGSPTMAYLDGILKRQHQLGLHDAQAVQAQWQRERAESEPVREILHAMGVKGTAPTKAWVDCYERMAASGLSHGVMLLAAGQVSRHGGKLDDFERLLEAWLARGLTDEAAVEAYLERVKNQNSLLLRLFERCGEARRPTARDRAMLDKWYEAGISEAVMEVAAEAAGNAEQKLAFMDKVLRSWHEEGIRTAAEARAARERHLGQSGAPAPAKAQQTRPSKEVAEHRYEQRQYTTEEMDALFMNLFPEEEEAR